MHPHPPNRHVAPLTKVRTQGICWYLDATFCYHFREIDSFFDLITVTRRLSVFASSPCVLPVLAFRLALDYVCHFSPPLPC